MKYEMPGCGGCRTCEMVCSFHHSNEFNPAKSSIRILEKKEGGGYRVELFSVNSGPIVACDGCAGLETPMCVLHCREQEELKLLLSEFLRRSRSAETDVENNNPIKR
jgi:Fe-S-cluster-containing hydrogenase component 2